MSVTIRLRKTDFTAVVMADSLAAQRIHGSSCRAYWLKQALVAAGWTVYYSSDGISTGSSDLWTSSAFQAILMQGYTTSASTLGTVDGVWSCLRSPDVDANGDYLHICLSPSQSQWYNPAVRGPTNAMGTYGVYAKVTTVGDWVSGQRNGFLRLGMALSSSSTAFSGGAPYVSTDTATARGTLPSATDAFWTTHTLGCGSANASTSSRYMTVLTEGNQFLVISSGSAGYAVANTRNWWGVSYMVDGGYATVEQSTGINSSSIQCSFLAGGRLWSNDATNIFYDTATELGGWRAGYIKKIGGTVYSGGLACPETPGWEALVDYPLNTSLIAPTGTAQLTAVSCSDPSIYSLGQFSDLVLMGSYGVPDTGKVMDGATSRQWVSFKDNKTYLLQWDWNDDPILFLAVTPPNSVT